MKKLFFLCVLAVLFTFSQSVQAQTQLQYDPSIKWFAVALETLRYSPSGGIKYEQTNQNGLTNMEILKMALPKNVKVEDVEIVTYFPVFNLNFNDPGRATFWFAVKMKKTN